MKAKMISVLLLLGLSPVTMAETYIGVGVGTTDYGIEEFDDPTGLTLYLGSQASANVAFEVSYTDFGTAEDRFFNDVDLNISTLGAGILMGAEAGPGARLFATVGLHAWDGEITSETLPYYEQDSGSDIYYGFGGSFDIAPGLAVGARYVKYDIEEDDISLATINLEARF